MPCSLVSLLLTSHYNRNDRIDLSPLLNQLIRKDYVVQESDVNWSTDSLLNDIKTFFRQHDGQE